VRVIVVCGRCGATAVAGSTPCRCSMVVEVVRCRCCGMLHEAGRVCTCRCSSGCSCSRASHFGDVVQTAASMGGVTEATLDAASRALRERAS
jgi:hypothetical protein